MKNVYHTTSITEPLVAFLAFSSVLAAQESFLHTCTEKEDAILHPLAVLNLIGQ